MTGYCFPSHVSKTLQECKDCIVTGNAVPCSIHQIIADMIQNVPWRYSDTSDPTVDDDETLGYKEGDLWHNTSDDGWFICNDASEGAADWSEISMV